MKLYFQVNNEETGTKTSFTQEVNPNNKSWVFNQYGFSYDPVTWEGSTVSGKVYPYGERLSIGTFTAQIIED